MFSSSFKLVVSRKLKVREAHVQWCLIKTPLLCVKPKPDISTIYRYIEQSYSDSESCLIIVAFKLIPHENSPLPSKTVLSFEDVTIAFYVQRWTQLYPKPVVFKVLAPFQTLVPYFWWTVLEISVSVEAKGLPLSISKTSFMVPFNGILRSASPL